MTDKREETIDSDSNATMRAEKAIIAHTNAEIAKVLDRLLEHSEDFTTFGDGGRSVAVEYIKAERNKLKENK
jgi:hypothetical protein